LEVVNFSEKAMLSVNEGTELIELIKWITYENGKEISLPKDYSYLK
jgi:hypothetical protein